MSWTCPAKALLVSRNEILSAHQTVKVHVNTVQDCPAPPVPQTLRSVGRPCQSAVCLVSASLCFPLLTCWYFICKETERRFSVPSADKKSCRTNKHLATCKYPTELSKRVSFLNLLKPPCNGYSPWGKNPRGLTRPGCVFFYTSVWLGKKRPEPNNDRKSKNFERVAS